MSQINQGLTRNNRIDYQILRGHS